MKKLLAILATAFALNAHALQKTEIPIFCDVDENFAEALNSMGYVPLLKGDNDTGDFPSKTIVAINMETNSFIVTVWFPKHRKLCGVSDGSLTKINAKILQLY